MSCTHRILAPTAAAALVAVASCSALRPALAQHPACLPAPEADARLRAEYDEAPAGYGLSGGRLAMLYLAADGATWTVTLTDPRTGLTCLIAAGSDWEMLEPPAPGDPS